MHLDKPSLAKYLGDPNLKGYSVLQKIFFAPTESSQAAGAAFFADLKTIPHPTLVVNGIHDEMNS